MKKIKQCECGSKDFIVNEGTSYIMTIDENGNLNQVKMLDNLIDDISCRKCGTGFSIDHFNELNFN